MEKILNNLKETNTIRLKLDKSCEMASVEVNDELVMVGNYWDFHNGCHGIYEIPNFSSYQSLIRVLERVIKSKGKHYKVIKEDWKYAMK